MVTRRFFRLHALAWIFFIASATGLQAATAGNENTYYPRYTLPIPKGIELEVGGIARLPDGRLAICTRHGEIWLAQNPRLLNGDLPSFHLFAEGLHEPLGILYDKGSLLVTQRGELTRLTDSDKDDVADLYETVYSWPLSTNYHEYSYGPVLAPDGSYFITTNIAFGISREPWRGWTLKISPDGEMTPWATGMRSPCGLGIFENELFYTDNQGEYFASGGVWHVPYGGFMGHPAGLRWSDLPGSPIDLTMEEFEKVVEEKGVNENGILVRPRDNPNETDPVLLHEAKAIFPELQLPAVILPHGLLGISNTEIIADSTDGAFGPFAGQLFVGDQGQSKIMRVFLEKVNGEYQGAAFDFRSGFNCGVLRMAWGDGGTMFVGETRRGWGSAGDRDFGLEFIEWSGTMPFEMKAVRAMPDGFEIEYTKPVDLKSANDLASYSGESFTYKYHSLYGSPQIHREALKIKGVKVSDDRLKVRIVVENLRQYFVHHIRANGILSEETKEGLLHDEAYYTLNSIPSGETLPAEALSTFRSATPEEPAEAISKSDASEISYKAIQPLLQKYTCVACHDEDRKLVGPAFREIAKRKYSPERIVQLIYQPEPENWPDYSTPMAPMSHVPEAQALEIAKWIASLSE